jgi:hypothetical protein
MYAAEREVPAFRANRLEELGECAAYAKAVMTSQFWIDECGKTWDVKIENGRSRALAFGWGRIAIPKWARTKMIVLHELSHIALSRTTLRDCKSIAPHGREFAAFYLKIVRRFLGVEVHDQLRAAFVKGGVKYKPKKVLSDEQREILRARGLVLAEKRKAAQREAERLRCVELGARLLGREIVLDMAASEQH